MPVVIEVCQICGASRPYFRRGLLPEPFPHFGSCPIGQSTGTTSYVEVVIASAGGAY